MSPRALELRIHGVNNTPPHDMLSSAADAVEMTRGDKFGSFWSPRQSSDHVRTEAYSWGGMARSSPTLPGRSIPVVNVLGRIGWALLLPFGLANVAYWSRKLPIGASRPDWRCGRGAATTRLFGLGLTVLLVLAMCEIALNLFAIQCAPTDSCTRLPGASGWFGQRDIATRIAVSSAGPVLLLLGLWLLTTLSRCRYEQKSTDKMRTGRGAVMLADPELWRGDSMLRELTRVHLAAGFAVVALVSSVDAGGTVFRIIAALAGALVVAACALASRRVADAPDVESEPHSERGSWLLLGFAVATLVAQVVGLLVLRPVLAAPLTVTTWLPPVVLACLLGIAVSAVAWRANPRRVPLVLGLAVAGGLIATRWHWAGAVVAVAAGAGLVWFARRDPERDWQAWSGMGPGVLLGLSLTSSMTLSTVAVVATGDWLLGVPKAPSVYVWFSGALTVALAALAVVVVVMGVLMVTRMIKPAELKGADLSDGLPRYVRARHLAALAHRAEKAVGLLAFLCLLALAMTVDATLSERRDLPQWVVDRGLWFTIAAGGAVVVTFVGGRAHRPLGLVWDLICFLPRAAHPFAPPCYAERAVPELVARTQEWLDEGPDRRVVLSAHSLGAVLAAATVYALPERDLPRLHLITYGSQLRPYFGRIFPELLGGVVLGTPQCRGGRLWSADPWRSCGGEARESGLSTMVVWTNLWRRTDFLGFPVHGYMSNDRDHPAPECNGDGRIQRHSDYQRSTEYRNVLTSHLEG